MSKKEIIRELNVEKLNICEKDGKVKMTLFNSMNMPPVVVDGVDIMPGHRQGSNTSGIMFYDGNGVECGGLIFGDNEGHGMSLTFDKQLQDQVIQIVTSECDGNHNYGMYLFDRPNYDIRETIKLSHEYQKAIGSEKQEILEKLQQANQKRAFIGKTSDGSVSVNLYDSKGNARIRLCIDKDDNPVIEVLDSQGNAIKTM